MLALIEIWGLFVQKNWLIEFCVHCNLPFSVSLVNEYAPGEDVAVREAVSDHRQKQRGDSPCLCSCGRKLIARYGFTYEANPVLN